MKKFIVIFMFAVAMIAAPACFAQSSASAKKIFKGTWEQTQSNGDYGEIYSVIDLDLYGKTVEGGEDGLCYGTVSQFNPNSGKIFTGVIITKVKSITGNKAVVECYDEFRDEKFTASLVYKPNTDTICYNGDLCISRKK